MTKKSGPHRTSTIDHRDSSRLLIFAVKTLALTLSLSIILTMPGTTAWADTSTKTNSSKSNGWSQAVGLASELGNAAPQILSAFGGGSSHGLATGIHPDTYNGMLDGIDMSKSEAMSAGIGRVIANRTGEVALIQATPNFDPTSGDGIGMSAAIHPINALTLGDDGSGIGSYNGQATNAQWITVQNDPQVQLDIGKVYAQDVTASNQIFEKEMAIRMGADQTEMRGMSLAIQDNLQNGNTDLDAAAKSFSTAMDHAKKLSQDLKDGIASDAMSERAAMDAYAKEAQDSLTQMALNVNKVADQLEAMRATLAASKQAVADGESKAAEFNPEYKSQNSERQAELDKYQQSIDQLAQVYDKMLTSSEKMQAQLQKLKDPSYIEQLANQNSLWNQLKRNWLAATEIAAGTIITVGGVALAFAGTTALGVGVAVGGVSLATNGIHNWKAGGETQNFVAWKDAKNQLATASATFDSAQAKLTETEKNYLVQAGLSKDEVEAYEKKSEQDSKDYNQKLLARQQSGQLAKDAKKDRDISASLAATNEEIRQQLREIGKMKTGQISGTSLNERANLISTLTGNAKKDIQASDAGWIAKTNADFQSKQRAALADLGTTPEALNAVQKEMNGGPLAAPTGTTTLDMLRKARALVMYQNAQADFNTAANNKGAAQVQYQLTSSQLTSLDRNVLASTWLAWDGADKSTAWSTAKAVFASTVSAAESGLSLLLTPVSIVTGIAMDATGRLLSVLGATDVGLQLENIGTHMVGSSAFMQALYRDDTGYAKDRFEVNGYSISPLGVLRDASGMMVDPTSQTAIFFQDAFDDAVRRGANPGEVSVDSILSGTDFGLIRRIALSKGNDLDAAFITSLQVAKTAADMMFLGGAGATGAISVANKVLGSLAGFGFVKGAAAGLSVALGLDDKLTSGVDRWDGGIDAAANILGMAVPHGFGAVAEATEGQSSVAAFAKGFGAGILKSTGNMGLEIAGGLIGQSVFGDSVGLGLGILGVKGIMTGTELAQQAAALDLQQMAAIKNGLGSDNTVDMQQLAIDGLSSRLTTSNVLQLMEDGKLDLSRRTLLGWMATDVLSGLKGSNTYTLDMANPDIKQAIDQIAANRGIQAAAPEAGLLDSIKDAGSRLWNSIPKLSFGMEPAIAGGPSLGGMDIPDETSHPVIAERSSLVPHSGEAAGAPKTETMPAAKPDSVLTPEFYKDPAGTLEGLKAKTDAASQALAEKPGDPDLAKAYKEASGNEQKALAEAQKIQLLLPDATKGWLVSVLPFIKSPAERLKESQAELTQRADDAKAVDALQSQLKSADDDGKQAEAAIQTATSGTDAERATVPHLELQKAEAKARADKLAAQIKGSDPATMDDLTQKHNRASLALKTSEIYVKETALANVADNGASETALQRQILQLRAEKATLEQKLTDNAENRQKVTNATLELKNFESQQAVPKTEEAAKQAASRLEQANLVSSAVDKAAQELSATQPEHANTFEEAKDEAKARLVERLASGENIDPAELLAQAKKEVDNVATPKALATAGNAPARLKNAMARVNNDLSLARARDTAAKLQAQVDGAKLAAATATDSGARTGAENNQRTAEKKLARANLETQAFRTRKMGLDASAKADAIESETARLKNRAAELAKDPQDTEAIERKLVQSRLAALAGNGDPQTSEEYQADLSRKAAAQAADVENLVTPEFNPEEFSQDLEQASKLIDQRLDMMRENADLADNQARQLLVTDADASTLSRWVQRLSKKLLVSTLAASSLFSAVDPGKVKPIDADTMAGREESAQIQDTKDASFSRKVELWTEESAIKARRTALLQDIRDSNKADVEATAEKSRTRITGDATAYLKKIAENSLTKEDKLVLGIKTGVSDKADSQTIEKWKNEASDTVEKWKNREIRIANDTENFEKTKADIEYAVATNNRAEATRLRSAIDENKITPKQQAALDTSLRNQTSIREVEPVQKTYLYEHQIRAALEAPDVKAYVESPDFAMTSYGFRDLLVKLYGVDGKDVSALLDNKDASTAQRDTLKKTIEDRLEKQLGSNYKDYGNKRFGEFVDLLKNSKLLSEDDTAKLTKTLENSQGQGVDALKELKEMLKSKWIALLPDSEGGDSKAAEELRKNVQSLRESLTGISDLRARTYLARLLGDVTIKATTEFELRGGQHAMQTAFASGNDKDNLGYNAGVDAGGGKTEALTLDQAVHWILLGKDYRGETDVEDKDAAARAVRRLSVRNIAAVFGLDLVDGSKLSAEHKIGELIDALHNPNALVYLDPVSRGHLMNRAVNDSDLMDALIQSNVINMDEFHQFLTGRTSAIVGADSQAPEKSLVNMTRRLVKEFQARKDPDSAISDPNARFFQRVLNETDFDSKIQKLNDEGREGLLEFNGRYKASDALLSHLEARGFDSGDILSVARAMTIGQGDANGYSIEYSASEGREVIMPVNGNSGIETEQINSNTVEDIARALINKRDPYSTVRVQVTENQTGLAFIFRNKYARQVGASATIDGLDRLSRMKVGAGTVGISMSKLDLDELALNENNAKLTRGAIHAEFDLTTPDGQKKLVDEMLRTWGTDENGARKGNLIIATDDVNIKEAIQKLLIERQIDKNNILAVDGRTTSAGVIAIADGDKKGGLGGNGKVIFINPRAYTGVDFQMHAKLWALGVERIPEQLMIQLLKRINRPGAVEDGKGVRWDGERHLVLTNLDALTKSLQFADEKRTDLARIWGSKDSTLGNTKAKGLLDQLNMNDRIQQLNNPDLDANTKNRLIKDSVELLAFARQADINSEAAKFAIQDTLRNTYVIEPLKAALAQFDKGSREYNLVKAELGRALNGGRNRFAPLSQADYEDQSRDAYMQQTFKQVIREADGVVSRLEQAGASWKNPRTWGSDQAKSLTAFTDGQRIKLIDLQKASDSKSYKDLTADDKRSISQTETAPELLAILKSASELIVDGSTAAQPDGRVVQAAQAADNAWKAIQKAVAQADVRGPAASVLNTAVGQRLAPSMQAVRDVQEALNKVDLSLLPQDHRFKVLTNLATNGSLNDLQTKLTDFARDANRSPSGAYFTHPLSYYGSGSLVKDTGNSVMAGLGTGVSAVKNIFTQFSAPSADALRGQAANLAFIGTGTNGLSAELQQAARTHLEQLSQQVGIDHSPIAQGAAIQRASNENKIAKLESGPDKASPETQAKITQLQKGNEFLVGVQAVASAAPVGSMESGNGYTVHHVLTDDGKPAIVVQVHTVADSDGNQRTTALTGIRLSQLADFAERTKQLMTVVRPANVYPSDSLIEGITKIADNVNNRNGNSLIVVTSAGDKSIPSTGMHPLKSTASFISAKWGGTDKKQGTVFDLSKVYEAQRTLAQAESELRAGLPPQLANSPNLDALLAQQTAPQRAELKRQVNQLRLFDAPHLNAAVQMGLIHLPELVDQPLKTLLQALTDAQTDDEAVKALVAYRQAVHDTHQAQLWTSPIALNAQIQTPTAVAVVQDFLTRNFQDFFGDPVFAQAFTPDVLAQIKELTAYRTRLTNIFNAAKERNSISAERAQQFSTIDGILKNIVDGNAGSYAHELAVSVRAISGIAAGNTNETWIALPEELDVLMTGTMDPALDSIRLINSDSYNAYMQDKQAFFTKLNLALQPLSGLQPLARDPLATGAQLFGLFGRGLGLVANRIPLIGPLLGAASATVVPIVMGIIGQLIFKTPPPVAAASKNEKSDFKKMGVTMLMSIIGLGESYGLPKPIKLAIILLGTALVLWIAGSVLSVSAVGGAVVALFGLGKAVTLSFSIIYVTFTKVAIVASFIDFGYGVTRRGFQKTTFAGEALTPVSPAISSAVGPEKDPAGSGAQVIPFPMPTEDKINTLMPPSPVKSFPYARAASITAVGVLGLTAGTSALSAATVEATGATAAAASASAFSFASMLPYFSMIVIPMVFLSIIFWPQIQAKLNTYSPNMPQGRNPADFLWNA